jgi:hypothetical protein
MPLINIYRRLAGAQSLHVQGHTAFLGLLSSSRHVKWPRRLETSKHTHVVITGACSFFSNSGEFIIFGVHTLPLETLTEACVRPLYSLILALLFWHSSYIFGRLPNKIWTRRFIIYPHCIAVCFLCTGSRNTLVPLNRSRQLFSKMLFSVPCIVTVSSLA